VYLEVCGFLPIDFTLLIDILFHPAFDTIGDGK